MVEQFFKDYAKAFLNFDSDYISAVYDFPMIFYTESGDSVSFELPAFTANTKKLISTYQQLGVKKVEFEIVSSVRLSDFIELVSLKWHFQDKDAREIYNATTRYLVKSDGTSLKIKSVFVVDETRQLKPLL